MRSHLKTTNILNMKNEILKLISELEARRKSHSDKAISARLADVEYIEYEHIGRERECDFLIAKLWLLLKDESKQPQPPDFANTMLGEVPHEVSAEHQESTQAVVGETPVVRQNEQTVKPCRCCLAEIKNDVGDGLCAECWSKLLTY